MSYRTIHWRLHKRQGPARKYPCIGCGGPARDWAYMHTAGENERQDENGTYSDDPDDYEPMCRSCHDEVDGFTAPARAALAERRRTDPARRERDVAAGHRLVAPRLECGTCGMMNNPGNAVRHSRASGHAA